MEDKIDELFDIIGNNKNTLILIIIGYVLLMIVVIAVIWWPEEKDYATYEKVNITEKQEALAQSYLNTLSNIFRNNKPNDLKNVISNRYINYTGKSSDEIINELTESGYFSSNAEVKGMNIYTDGDTYVYSTTVYSETNERNINIIERYPYDYEIVFDDFYSYDEKGTTTTAKNIKFTVDNVYRNLKYVEINMKIENLNEVYARFDFNSTIGVQAVLQDGTRVTASNLVSGESYTNIEPNMMVNKNFVFEIPAQLQEEIEYILFGGVSLEFSQLDIKVNI